MHIEPYPYAPIVDKNEQPTESFEEYAGRMETELPNIPRGVLRQWAYDHPTQFRRWSFLGLPELRFDLVRWSTEKFVATDFGADVSLYVLLHHYQNGKKEYKRRNIEKSFKANGTWPHPVIVLHRPNGLAGHEPGWCRNVPYFLIEGHHRAAVLLLWAEQGSTANDEHEVWLVTQYC